MFLITKLLLFTTSYLHELLEERKVGRLEKQKLGRLEELNMERKKDLKHFRDLEVYQKAFELAMKIFEITKSFPSEEKYSLVDQKRRSSRSVCSNLAEAWRKRKYKAVFINKLTDAMQEASESQSWLEFALACK